MDAANYRDMSARARRLARTVGDKRTEKELLAAADEYEAKAAALEQGISVPPQMGEPRQPQQQQQQQIQPDQETESPPKPTESST